jgi:hypothetical protein
MPFHVDIHLDVMIFVKRGIEILWGNHVKSFLLNFTYMQ